MSEAETGRRSIAFKSEAEVLLITPWSILNDVRMSGTKNKFSLNMQVPPSLLNKSGVELRTISGLAAVAEISPRSNGIDGSPKRALQSFLDSIDRTWLAGTQLRSPDRPALWVTSLNKGHTLVWLNENSVQSMWRKRL